nr:MAG TPA: SOS-response transcriptional repressor [Caudoviricetes sp.]
MRTAEELRNEIKEKAQTIGVNETQICKLAGISQPNYSRKVNNGMLRFDEVERIMAAMGYDIVFVKNETGPRSLVPGAVVTVIKEELDK